MKSILAIVLLFCAMATVSGARAAEDIEIDRVSFLGVSVFSTEVLESNLQIAAGDHLSRSGVLATEGKIQKLYADRGYREARIVSRLIRKRVRDRESETVLEFNVQEGRADRIAGLKIIKEGVEDREADDFFKEKYDKFAAGIALLPGRVLDLTRIEEGKRAVQELLASAEFIGGRVLEVSIVATETSKVPETLVSAHQNDTRQWVNVTVKLDVGEKVFFGFRGNKIFTLGYLATLISEQRLVGLGKDYIAAVKLKIEEEYHSLGYADVSITPFIYGTVRNARRVTYVIEEGTRVKINSIQFDGNSIFSNEELLNIFYSKASTLVQHKFFVEKDITKAAEGLLEHMKELGYLSARLVGVSSVRIPEPKNKKSPPSQNVVIYVFEGDQTLVRKISIEGASRIPATKLAEVLGVREGTPLNLYALAEGIEAIKKVYRSEGYLTIRILNEGTADLVNYAQDNRVADVAIKIEEGSQIRVSQIVIEGLGSSQEVVVRRELTFNEGDVLTQGALEQTERALRRLGIFSDIVIRTTDDPKGPEYRIVHFELKEADRGVLTYGPGFRYDLGIRAFATMAYTNLWGLNHSVALYLAANRRFYLYNFGEGQAQLAYTWPWFGLKQMTFRPTLTVGRTQYINFSANTATIAATWDKQLGSPHLVGYFSYAYEYINQFNALLPGDNNQMTLGSITPRLSLDLRDNPLAPRSGYYAVAWADISGTALGSQVEPFPIGYFRIQIRQDYSVSIGPDVTWYLSFRTGFEQSTTRTRDDNAVSPNSSRDAIPLVKQFTMGGIGSLRGYREQELNFQDRNIFDSITYVNYRTQVDLPFAGSLKFGVFFDAANLLIDSYSPTKDLRCGTGFGFHYSTPVGMVALDWGWKLNPLPNTDPYVIHFSVGVI